MRKILPEGSTSMCVNGNRKSCFEMYALENDVALECNIPRNQVWMVHKHTRQLSYDTEHTSVLCAWAGVFRKRSCTRCNIVCNIVKLVGSARKQIWFKIYEVWSLTWCSEKSGPSGSSLGLRTEWQLVALRIWMCQFVTKFLENTIFPTETTYILGK